MFQVNNRTAYQGRVPFERANARMETRGLERQFLHHFGQIGSIEESPIRVTSRIDPTVRFIGSHISVLKGYFEDRPLPHRGVMIVQSCVRTHNAKHLGDDFYSPKWGSYFSSLGVLAPHHCLSLFFRHSVQFFTEGVGLNPEDVLVRVSSKDADLLHVCKLFCSPGVIEVDSRPLGYYRHTIGIQRIQGRNLNFALKGANGIFEDVGNYIVFERDGIPCAIEVAIGVSTTLKQRWHLSHVLDCHPLPELPRPHITSHRQFEDVVITVVALFREALYPSNRDNQARILKSYVRALKTFAIRAAVDDDTLASLIDAYQQHEYGDNVLLGKAIVATMHSITSDIAHPEHTKSE